MIKLLLGIVALLALLVVVAVPAGGWKIEADTDSGDSEVQGLTRVDGAPRSIEASSDSGDVRVRRR